MSAAEQKLKKLSDKVLHCLARIIQDEGSKECVRCLYCKYAIDCADEFKKTRNILWVKLLKELEENTSVDISLNQETKAQDILKGSWAEKYPDALKMLTKKSFEEQQGILKDSGIFQYLDS